MAENRIGITIATQTTGGDQLREHIQQVTQLNEGWRSFNNLRREAAEQYPDDLKKQNTYIREQLQITRELETVGNRQRMAEAQHQKETARGYFARQDAIKAIKKEKGRHLEEQTTFAEISAHRRQWVLDQGIGDPATRDTMGQMAAAGVRGGGMGMLQQGLGSATSAMTKKMAGMGLAGKLALGLTAGAAIGGAVFAVTQLKKGWDLYKNLAPELLKIAAISGKLPADAERFRDTFLEVALATGTATAELIQYEKQWLTILGAGATGAQGGKSGTLASVLNMSKAYGIDPGAGTEFAARMGMTGYRSIASDEMLKRAIADGMASGIGIARLPEYLLGLQQVTSAVLKTSLTTNPAMLSAYAREIGTLGLPFQGARGAQILGGLHQGMQGGMGFQAARIALGPDASLFDIKFLQQQGAADPRMMAGFVSLFGGMAGVEGKTGKDLIEARKWQALFMYQQMPDIPLSAFFNPDKDINSLTEMNLDQLRNLKPGKLADITGTTSEEKEILRKIEEYQKAFGFVSQQADIAADIARINSAAYLFESTARFFYDGVLAMAAISLMPDVDTKPITYDATNTRQFGMGYGIGLQPDVDQRSSRLRTAGSKYRGYGN